MRRVHSPFWSLPRQPSLHIVLVCALHHAAMCGTRIVLPLLALQRGGSQSLAGMLIATQALAPALLSLPIAALIDRLGTRRCAALGTACSAMLLLGLGMATHVALLFVLAAGVGVGYGLCSISAQRALGQCLAEGDSRAYERFSLATALSACAGPLLAGAGMAAGGAQLGLAGLGALALGALLVLLAPGALGALGVDHAARAGGAFVGTWPQQGLRAVETSVIAPAPASLGRGVHAVLAAETVISMSWNALATMVILRAHAEAWPAQQLTWVVALLGLGVLLARLVGPRLLAGWADAALMRVSMAAAMLALLSFAGHWPWWAHGCVQMLAGVGLGLSLSPALTLLHQRSRPAAHTRTLAVRNLLLNGCAVAGPALVGAAVGSFGTAAACVAMVVAALVAALSIRL